MFRIKRLYTFIYQTFLPTFVMTFGICLFIFIIQFLWQYIDELVGKGLDTSVIVEFFAYASIMLIPQALPLAILLASLMTFGNMGERFELVAIKASGVSLMRIMKPMIVLIAFVSLASFVFQNNINPRIQVKVYTLLYSIKQASPELDIPEGAFYSNENLKGYSIYVKEKDLKTHMLRDVIIYDTSRGGFKNMSVDVCDSAIMKVADSKDYLVLTMFNGERFSNGNENSGGNRNGQATTFVTESYEKKDVVIPFDGEFSRIDESAYDKSQISKNLVQLKHASDSMQLKLDSLNQLDRRTILSQAFLNNQTTGSKEALEKDTIVDKENKVEKTKNAGSSNLKVMSLDSIFESYAVSTQSEILNMAAADARNNAGNQLTFYHLETPKPNLQRSIRMHDITWHKMFSLSFACLIFFFIGAPLGAIIRKGGLGVPVVISVLLFIVYYIIDHFGYKMSRDGMWPAWQGIWLSTAILFPLGVFLTYKSMRESDIFNVELYGKYFRKQFKIKSDQNRSIVREPRLEEILPIDRLDISPEEIETFSSFDNNLLKDIVNNHAEYDYGFKEQQLALSILKERGTYLFDVRVNNYDLEYSSKLISYFRSNSIYVCIPLYGLSIVALLVNEIFKIGGSFSIAVLGIIIYTLFYAKSMIYISDFYKSINLNRKASKVFIEKFLCFFFYPVYHSVVVDKMKQKLDMIRHR